MHYALFQQYRLHALHFSIHKRFITAIKLCELSWLCKPAMPGSPWHSPRRLLGGSQRTEDSLGPAPGRLSPRSRRQMSQARSLVRSMAPTLLPRRKAVSKQQREEKRSRASSFSHKALAQAAAAARGMPSIASALRAVSAMPLACATL